VGFNGIRRENARSLWYKTPVIASHFECDLLWLALLVIGIVFTPAQVRRFTAEFMKNSIFAV
jgi:hypothetical protein